MEQFVYLTTESSLKNLQFVVSNPENVSDETARQLLNRLFKQHEEMFLLQGSGFNMANQIDQWLNEFDPSNPETKQRIIDKTMSDVRGFYHEFLSRRDIFPFDLEIRTNNENRKYVHSTKYDQPLENITRADERDGAMLDGIKIATNLIANAKPGTVVFLNSSKGWSGLPTGAHSDNQTYVYWIDNEGDLKALTLRSDIGIQTSEKLVGIEKIEASLIDRIKNIVKKPVAMRVVGDGFIQVLDLIENASGEKLNKLRHEITNRETYIQLTDKEDQEVKQILDNLESFLNFEINDKDEATIKKLAAAIGKSILDMQHAVNKREAKYNSETRAVVGFDDDRVKYQVLSQEVKQILGCSNGIKERSFGFDSKGPLDFSCHKCNGTNTRPYEGYCTECKHCGAVFDGCGAQ